MSEPKINQPETIRFNRRKYTLISPLRKIDDAITEGPFYRRAGVNPEDWAFMPDVSFLIGRTEKPAFMHCIQQSPTPKSKRPE